MSGFARLHPAIQYHIVNSLGWPELRPLQEQSVTPILDCQHVLLIAPTAGGKTEAAVLPVLSRMLAEDWRGLSVLYICPIKALLNNLEPRLAGLAGLVGRSAHLWHGDVSSAEKRSVERELPDLLLTTPESLEGILIGGRRDHQHLLGGVRCVVIDELHAFAGDDRGWHVLALLERITQLSGREIQRIGLSATVGDPATLLYWLAGHCEGGRTLVQIKGPPAEVDLRVDYVGSLDNAATLISQLHAGEKRLVFCDSRSRVEELALGLRARGVDVFVSHAALAVDTRRQAEQAFAEKQNCVIVATSTLELGLDVGDLDRVIQIDAPGSVASFLQRLGRTGRRVGSRRNMLFIATRDLGLLESLAIVQLFRSGYVEPVAAPPLPFHILVQQLFAALMQHGRELPESDFVRSLSRVPEFSRLLIEAWDDLRGFLVEAGYLQVEGAMLQLGPRAERRFAGKGLADLCVSFDSPRVFAAYHGQRPLGQIDPLMLTASNDGPRILALGGRSWRVVSVEWSRQSVYVEPAEEKGRSQWLGEARGLSRPLAQEVRRTLERGSEGLEGLLTKRSSPHLRELCEQLEHTLTYEPIRLPDGTVELWTYGGLAANVLLAGRCRAAGASIKSISSYHVRCSISDALIEKAGGWTAVNRLDVVVDIEPNQRLKFADLLPESILRRLTTARLVKEAGVVNE